MMEEYSDTLLVIRVLLVTFCIDGRYCVLYYTSRKAIPKLWYSITCYYCGIRYFNDSIVFHLTLLMMMELFHSIDLGKVMMVKLFVMIVVWWWLTILLCDDDPRGMIMCVVIDDDDMATLVLINSTCRWKEHLLFRRYPLLMEYLMMTVMMIRWFLRLDDGILYVNIKCYSRVLW